MDCEPSDSNVMDFVQAMSAAATQVTLVTTNGGAGRFGVTVSAFASVSAEPPMVLVCINRKSPTVSAIAENKCFCVNLLSDDQEAVAECFAGRSNKHSPYDFNCASWEVGETGTSVLVGACASFDCHLDSFHDHGTHSIFVGKVVTSKGQPSPPLAFSQRTYQQLLPSDGKTK